VKLIFNVSILSDEFWWIYAQ